MTDLTIVGGVYRERCIRPSWDAIYGSGGRAAVAAASLANTKLISYVHDHLKNDVENLARLSDFHIHPIASYDPISFYYIHPLANPLISPSLHLIKKNPPISVRADVVLRYGMLEGTAIVDAKVAIYDPQSAFAAEGFRANGSRADRLAIVLNRYEAQSIVGTADAALAADRLIQKEGAEVVVVKMGSNGALVSWIGGSELIPAYKTESVWKIGSGDVYSTAFSVFWGVNGMNAADAARYASIATADYCNGRTLPIREPSNLNLLEFKPVIPGNGKIYLASPFFDLGQRWLVEESLAALRNMGAQVFSPVHDVGPGPAEIVCPADIQGLDESQVVFAIINGLDAGTIFEVGYAIKKGIPVVALAENIKEEDLKMFLGTGCVVTNDFTSAIYQAIWMMPE
ncbi:nucleoside 2-deoxyribosyltransferase family [Nitrospirillum viridazoti Y2]|uniref:PfkB family carbohydrate kinase n=1 Tax=Nitrospirillum viridazoti TaxID=3144925 RepID=UPI000226541F|nr:PfkB family carbohydrate kinase [Nitrospirillum amazonense]EGY00582.1 nucleoside 2-deoxyribosyltransferase family [Nitrospirillum amazonense Y2]